MNIATLNASTLKKFGIESDASGDVSSYSPIDGELLAAIKSTPVQDVDGVVARAHQAFQEWRNVSAPRRGELIRLFGEELRAAKADLGRLVSLEAGKILTEGQGEVQEMIDICDFAVGLSRQLYGLTIASERPGHRMMETWHPLGVVGVISAFNFPVAVWSWNLAVAIVCGNSVVWKPSEKTPLTAIACQRLFERAVQRFGSVPEGLMQVVQELRGVGEALVDHPAWRWSRPPAAPAWAARSARAWPRASAAASWNWAATTPSS
jgi:aldehyde dehydrogenase (NAD+)